MHAEYAVVYERRQAAAQHKHRVSLLSSFALAHVHPPQHWKQLAWLNALYKHDHTSAQLSKGVWRRHGAKSLQYTHQARLCFPANAQTGRDAHLR